MTLFHDRRSIRSHAGLVSALAAEASRVRVESYEWQVAEIRAALEEVDVGDFAAANEVAALARERNGNAG